MEKVFIYVLDLSQSDFPLMFLPPTFEMFWTPIFSSVFLLIYWEYHVKKDVLQDVLLKKI